MNISPVTDRWNHTIHISALIKEMENLNFSGNSIYEDICAEINTENSEGFTKVKSRD